MEHSPKALTAAIEGLYFPDPPQSFVDMMGGEIDDYRPTVELPEFVSGSFSFFQRIDSQWRTGPGGLIGLDYTVIPMMAKIYGLEVTPDLMDDIATMEAAAIKTIMGNQKS
ncbi:DUF1799 domain-containing protein [Klebsiella phage vB_KaeS_Diencephalon]|nr:DUF1799 domain-containing protein [Klebsiella phage vB_KaeS_Diencephalon]UVX30843.1 tail length tape measure protein [Klebsiella phage VLCpiS8a]